MCEHDRIDNCDNCGEKTMHIFSGSGLKKVCQKCGYTYVTDSTRKEFGFWYLWCRLTDREYLKEKGVIKEECLWCDEPIYEDRLCEFHFDQEISNNQGVL